MKPILYQFSTSPLCAKLRKLMHYKGVDFDTIEIDYLKGKELPDGPPVPALTLPGGETIVDWERIALRIEELYPVPTVLPPDLRGIHLALSRYIDGEVEDALLRLATPDEIAHFRRLGHEHEAFFRLIRERKYGVGFCDRMESESAANRERASKLLSPFEEALRGKAFILGRIGLADFALYGQLYQLAISGQLKLPAEFPNLRMFFERIDRISSDLTALA
jgi:glutathione S-transferase